MRATLFLVLSLLAVQAEPVGIAGRRMDVFLPGPELSVSPLQTGKDPLDLRILAVYPHGTAGFRYDLEYIGYVPGLLNLSSWLVPKDGAPTIALPPVAVDVTSVLPAGKPGSLEKPAFQPRGIGGGYTLVLLLLVSAWLAGGVALLAAGLRALRRTAPESARLPRTPAEQLRPWIEHALRGELDASGKAELERRIMGFWRNQLDLTALPPGEALQKIREDKEAGQLLRLIENWLHNPAARISEAEVNHALEPYGRPIKP